MAAKSADEILRTLQSGVMAIAAKDVSEADKIAIAEYLSGKRLEQKRGALADGGRCQATLPVSTSEGPQWNGWGNDITNSRFQSAAAAAITPETVKKLKLKWAFGFEGAISANAQPTAVGGRILVGGGDRKVHSLDAKTGCTHWALSTDAAVRTGISVGRLEGSDDQAAYFGDVAANAYAVNASTGALIWKTKLETHAAARITGTPTLYSGVLYVPLSSIEEAVGSPDTYQCCTFRGSVVALDARTGRQIWKTYTIAEEPRPTTPNAAGTQGYGPSGAAVWTAPTIDIKRQALYIATGNNYSNPPVDTSDAVIALDLKTGAMLWHQQATANDAFMVGCFYPNKPNCPTNSGPDHDFGQSPILVTLAEGKRLLVTGQKSGIVHAMDPDQQGKIVWQSRVGQGGTHRRDRVGLGRRPGSRVCRQLRRQISGSKEAQFPRRRRIIQHRTGNRKDRVEDATVRMWRAQTVQPRAVSRSDCHSGHRVLGRRQRIFARLFDNRRCIVVAVRHGR